MPTTCSRWKLAFFLLLFISQQAVILHLYARQNHILIKRNHERFDTHIQYCSNIELIDHRNHSTTLPASSKYQDQGQPKKILEYFQGKEHGTFIEAGANDGFHSSNSLRLETTHKWRGLLIEPVPDLYAKLLMSKRPAMFLNACLSPKPFAYMLIQVENNFINHHDEQKEMDLLAGYKNLLEPLGYRLFANVKADYIFVKKIPEI